MAPDDAHDAYDTQGQTGVSPETRRLAEEVLDEVLPEAAGRQVVVESARVEERPAAVVAASGVTDEVLPEAAGRQVGVEGQEEWLSAEGPASVALPAVSGSVEERAAIAEEVPAKDLVEASAEGPKEQVPAVGLVEEVPAADLEEPERGRRPHRTGPSRRSRAVSFDVPDSRRATHQEDTSGRPVRPEAEPAPASRPALAGLNLDAVPVGRAPAEPGGVSERVAEPLAVPEEVPAAVPVTVEVGRAQADPAAVPAEDVQAARGELDEVEQVGRDKGKDKGKAAVVPPVVLPVDSGNQSGEGRQAPPSARTADGDNASRPPGTGDPVAAAHAAENPPLVEVTPAVVEAVPAVVEAAPAVVEVTPAAVEAVPAVVEVTPAVVEAVPAVVEVTPAVVEAVPAVVEVAPVVVEAVPAVVEVAPVVAEVTSPAVGTTHPLTAAPPGTAPGTPVVDPDRIAEPPRVIGRSVPVPATGDCLLYSFAASDPLYIRDRLPGLNTRHPQAYAWLGDPDAVRAELGALAAAYSETRVLPDTGHSRVVIDAMRGQAASHLGEHAGALSPQILQQLRGALTPGFGARVAGMARADLLTHLAHHRVTTPATFEGLGLESELRTRYRNARAAELIGRGERPAAEVQAEVQAEAEILGTRELFGRLAQRGLLPPVAELTTDQLRTVLSTAYVGSTAPLDRGESVAVAEAVTNWAGNWDSPVGEMFLPLLARAFGVRADVVRAGRGEITSVGPDDATHRIEVHYNGVDHYNGSDVAGWPLPSAQDERLLSAGPQPVASGSATPAPAPAPALNLSEGTPPTVLAPLPARTSLAFPSGAHDVGAEALERIRELAGKVAKAGILANYAKIALPRFSVVGHGNGPLLAVGDRGARRASEVGGLRAKAAADTLYDELVRALQFLQANTPGEDLIAASDFDFDERSAGRDLGDGRGDGSPRDRRRQAVIGIVEAPRAAAAARLDALRRQDPRFAAGRFDPDTLARHVLHLPAGATVTAADRDALYALVDRAAAVGQARSVARLGAFHLRGHGLLSETTFTALAGASPTRNWMGIPLTGIDTATYDETVGTVTRQVTPPWVTGPAAPPPYVVVAAGGDDRGISVAGTSGPPRRVTAEDLTELLAMDDRLAALGKDVPVLLVAPGAGSMGLDLPRAVAAGTGRTVWAHSGAPALIAPAGGVLYRIGVAGDRAGGIPLGQWIPSHPGDLGTPNPDAGNAVVETIAGVRVPDRDIVSVAMAPNGVRKGRALFSDADLAMRERYFDVTTQLTDWYPADPVQHDFDGPRPMPVRGGLAYFVYVHGRPGATMVNVRHDPTPRQVTGRQFGRFLRRRPSVRDLDPAVPFVLLSCWGAAAPGLPNWIDAPGARAPFVADPLSTLSVAEEVADENGRTVFASDRVHVGFTRSNGTHGHGIVSDPLGETGEWREVRPRPSDAELADLARVAGLYDGPGPVPKQVTDTTLRLVRALRVLFGPSIEDNRHDPADPYRELLRGMGTLEIMRDRHPGLAGYGELTLDLVDRVVRGHQGIPHTPGVRPAPLGQDAIRATLIAAAALPGGSRLPALDGFAPMPSVDRARELIGRGDPDETVRDVLALAANAPVTRADRAHVLWAAVKAVESVENVPNGRALAMEVLHLPPGANPDTDQVRADLFWTAMTAAAVGRDSYHPAALAAHDLELHGALGPQTLLRSDTGAVIGRNWTGRPVQGTLVTDTFRLAAPGAAPGFRAWQSHWKTPGRPATAPDQVYLLAADGLDGHIDMPWPSWASPAGGPATRRVPPAEIAELLTQDRHLHKMDPQMSYLLPVGLSGSLDDLADRLVSRTTLGRAVLAADQPLRLVHLPADDQTVLVMTLAGHGGPQSGWVQTLPQPIRWSPRPTPAPAPTPAPVSAPAPARVTTSALASAPQPATTDRDRMTSGHEPAPASRPALSGLNRDADPVGRAPAEPGVVPAEAVVVSERVAEPLADPVAARTADPAAAYEDAQAVPQEQRSRSEAARPGMLEPGESRTVPGPPLIVLTPPTTADDEPAAGHQEPAGGIPWFARHGMLGGAEVLDVPQWTADQAATAAAEVVDRLALGADVSAAVRRAVRDNVRELLLERGAEAWQEILLHGRLLVADGRLVWLRPVLDGGSAVALPPGPDDPVRRYHVSFNATSADHVTSHAVNHTADILLSTAINVASAAASAAVIGVPQVAVSAGGVKQTGGHHTVIGGRKLFVKDTNSFTAGLRVQVFVDGEEQHPAEASRPPVVDRGLTVRFPSQLSRSTEPDPALADPAPRNVRSLPHQRFRRAGEVLHAIDVTPMLADDQRYLRRTLGLGAEKALEVVEQSQPGLNEESVLNRARWWLSSGDVSTKIRVGRSLKGLKPFRGHLRRRMVVESAQFLQVMSDADVREDRGAGYTAISGEGGESGLSLFGGFNMTGLVDPVLGSADRVKGLAPLLGVTAAFGQDWSRGLDSQGLVHAVVNTTEVQARYRVRLRVTRDWILGSHRRMDTVDSVVEAELGVLWDDGKGAADFERRVLGGVRTPYVLGALAGQVPASVVTRGGGTLKLWPAPVEAQPHVRALLAAAKVSPVRRHRRPASLDALHTPHPKEPLWLAARKGFGFHASVALPGAERVEDHFRARLEEWSAPSDGPLTRPFRGLTGRRDPARGRFSTDTKLATYVGRPALEGKFGTAMGGFKEEITYQGRRYEMGVRAHLTEHLGYRFHQAKINVRAAKGEGAVAGRGGKWEVKGGAGGGARVSLGSFLRLQASTLRLLARYGRGHKDSLESVAKGYRRTETDGDVHEHVYNVVYELTLRPLSGEGRAETWFVSRDKSLVAQISVPDQYVPAIPPSMEEVIATGRTAVLSELPAGRTLNLRNATTGLYPFFQTVPELARAAARAYARIHGLDTISADDFERMPREIVNATGPDELTVWTDHLADGLGREVELPEHDGWKTTMMLHLAAYDAQRLPGEATEAEIEQLAQLARRRTRERHTGIGLGVRVDLGPQARFGSDQGGEVEATDSHAGSGGTGEHTRPPGGRFAFLAHGQYETEWVSSHGSSDGFVENSRATYNGKKARFGAGSVFTVVMVRHKGQKVETDTSYVHSERGMHLLIPERLVEDVLPAQDEDVLTAQDEEVNAAPLRVYAGGQIPTSAMFIERLDVDVLGAIRQRLLDQGQLPRRTTADGTVMDALDPLSRALRAIFRSSALMLSGPALLDLGLWFAIKVEGIGGASWDQIVNVRFARVDAADAHRARPEVDLTLRGESTGERKDGSKFRRVLDFGVIAAGHGGTHVTDGGSHGNGGLDVAGGWSAVHSQGTDGAQKDVFIYRATTKGGSEEFQHNVALQIELGTALALPASASLVTAPGRLMNLGAGAVARIFDRRDDYDMFLETLRPWVRYDDGADRLVPGRMRVLVPSYLTAPMPEGTTAKPGPAFVRGYGQSPRWRDAVPAPAALSEELSGALHSWGVSAAAAMQRWVKVAAFDAGREGRLDLATPWEVPGIDITTKAGRDYLHDTSHTRIRPRILELLGHRHVVKVGNREVMVGFELSKAAEFAPSTDEVRHKARHYRQQDAEQKAEAEHERGWYVGVGPVGGGGSGQETFLGRLTPYERASVRGGKDTAGQAQTDESNRESTRDYRYYRFWVKLVMTPLHRPGRQLTVDVPDGLIGMLPRDDADRLVGELLARYPQPPAEPRRGRLQPRTEPSPRAHAVSSDPATTGRHRTTAEPEPAPASRPVLGGLNLDSVPVDRPRAERTPTDTVPAEPAVSAPVERVVPVEQPTGQAVPVEVAASERAPERAEQPAGQAVPVEVAASAPVERVEPAVPLARETAPADAARVEPVAATPVLPEGVRMLPITPRLTLHRFDLDGGQSGLSVAELDAAQALLEQDDPAVGEAHAAELGARVAAKITAQWAAEGLDPSQAGVELHMEAPARIAVAMVLARTVTDTLRHRVHVTVGRMAAIEMCPSGIA
ncbi:lonely Cys domain-containing protein [Actinacidiphila cocklensis]|uniref:Lonely Cys domain-containing protein n=1 Tax=Actinacidiphila cocklensis TaxID=887465 RepID=A0A9W4GW47_9ACTN|nr:lonely Cys domain-containing protein [Actinacidiphila cocklensis]CAG6398608.1 hypothetical protein SCOCK_700021 [Actinacidiphila cocklensis]